MYLQSALGSTLEGKQKKHSHFSGLHDNLLINSEMALARYSYSNQNACFLYSSICFLQDRHHTGTTQLMNILRETRNETGRAKEPTYKVSEDHENNGVIASLNDR